MIRDIFHTFGAVITRNRDEAPEPVWTPAMRNVRVLVGVHPQQAPEAPRQGDIPSRPAKLQIQTAFYDTNAWSAEGFAFGQAGNVDIEGDLASAPYGLQAPWNERANMAPPQHVAYGSLFYYQPTVYGIE